MKSKSIFTLAITLSLFSILSGCHTSESDPLGDWNYRDAGIFEGAARYGAAGFVIDNKAYLVGGYQYDNNTKERLKDVWTFDPTTNIWKEIKSTFSGVGRNGAVGFSLNGKGYVGLGIDDNGNYLNDFYVFDPTTNKWDTIAAFPGTGRVGSVAFGINGKGYVGTGYDKSYKSDFYEYDPTANTWTQIVGYQGGKVRGAVSFIVGDKAYVGFGEGGSLFRSVFEFDPTKVSTNPWTKKESLTNSTYDEVKGRSYANAFTIGTKAYICLGANGSALTDYTWEYDPSADTWTKKTSFEGYSRYSAIGFAINNRGYIVTGTQSGTGLDDFWYFDPLLAKDTDDNTK